MFVIILHERGILVHLERSIFGVFEILNNYGTSWKIYPGIPLNIPTPTPAPDHPLGGHERGQGFIFVVSNEGYGSGRARENVVAEHPFCCVLLVAKLEIRKVVDARKVDDPNVGGG